MSKIEHEWVQKYLKGKDSKFIVKLDMVNTIKGAVMVIDGKVEELNVKKFRKFFAKKYLYSSERGDMRYEGNTKYYTMHLLPIFLKEYQENN